MDPNDIHQAGEIKNVGWFTYEQCLQLLRPYDTARIALLERVNKQITENH